METMKRFGIAMLVMAAVAVAPARATTLIRAGVEDLADNSSTILVGEVVGATSYWNWEGTNILTEVRVAPTEVIKGRVDARELRVTLMGGVVDDLAVVVVGGAELVPGQSYVLFLNQDDLPGAPGVVTVRHHSQGAFDVVESGGGGLRALSQANRHSLAADRSGRRDALGGPQGMPLGELVESVREAVRRAAARQEVTR